MTQDLIPVRREDVKTFKRICACLIYSGTYVPLGGGEQFKDHLARLDAALSTPSLSETTKDQAQPDLALQERGQGGVPAGWKLVPIVPTFEIIRGMSESVACDDEGVFPSMCDLLDFSGENKTHTVLRAAYVAAMVAAPSPPTKEDQ